MQKLSDYVMTTEAAEVLGVSQNTLRKWARKGKDPDAPESGERIPAVSAQRSAGFSQEDCTTD